MEKLYPDFGHPNGLGETPWFRISGTESYTRTSVIPMVLVPRLGID